MPAIVWKGHRTFGLVSIPVKLFRAARRERVRLHYVHRSSALEPVEPADVAADVPVMDRAALMVPRTATGRSQSAEAVPAVPERTESAAAPPVPVSRVRQTLVGA